MNRAILIVICDFLVSTMLSMMTGMVPVHTGGTGVSGKAAIFRTHNPDRTSSENRLVAPEILKTLNLYWAISL